MAVSIRTFISLALLWRWSWRAGFSRVDKAGGREGATDKAGGREGATEATYSVCRPIAANGDSRDATAFAIIFVSVK